MLVRFEIRCTACHYKCRTSIIIDCEGDVTRDDPDLRNMKCPIDDRPATWESDDF